ncbi:MAG: hypothetical protein HY958_03100 [Bacteroidia bacterium]|nr:hypothetical protein [Bacteroidia bacterium]
MKHLFLFLGFFVMPIIAFNQNWIPYSSNDKLKIEYMYSDCYDKTNGINRQNVLLRYTNFTNTTLEITLTITTTYTKNDKEFQTQGDKPKLTVTLLPGQSLEGDCLQKNRTLVLFSKMLDTGASVLKNFTIEINDITIK